MIVIPQKKPAKPATPEQAEAVRAGIAQLQNDQIQAGLAKLSPDMREAVKRRLKL